MAALGRVLRSLSYQETLARGYAVVRDGAGALVTTREAAAAAGALEIEFADGTLGVGAAGAPRKPRAPKPAPDDQGSLF